MKKQLETEIKVGLFVSAGLALTMLAILVIGGNQSFLSSKNRFNAHFNNVDGLISGARVVMGGVNVGTIDSIEFDQTTRDVKVQFSVSKESSSWIRKDSTVEIATQGVLGDKYLILHSGQEGEPQLPALSTILTRPSRDITNLFSKSDQLLVNLTSISTSLDRILKNFDQDNRSETFFKSLAATAKNLNQISEKMNTQLTDIQFKQAVGHLNQILEKVNNGTGTLGALVNDASLYDQTKALLGGANRNRLIRNLVRQSVKSGSETPK